MKESVKKIIIGTLLCFAAVSVTVAQSENDFEVTLNEDGTGAVITKYRGKGGDVVIPSVIQGYPVKEIKTNSSDVFAWEKITSVVIPDSVEVLTDSLFYGQKNLTKVVFPKNLKKIESSCFGSCKSLKEIVLPDSLEEIARDAFSDCPLVNVVLPKGEVKILPNALDLQMKKFTITKNMKFYSFDDAPNIYANGMEELIIDADVEELPTWPFIYSYTLKTIIFKSPDTKIYKNTFDNCMRNLNLASQAEIRKHMAE